MLYIPLKVATLAWRTERIFSPILLGLLLLSSCTDSRSGLPARDSASQTLDARAVEVSFASSDTATGSRDGLPETDTLLPARDTIARAPVRAYTPFAVVNYGTFRDFSEAVGPQWLTNVLKVNRLDLEHVRQGDTLVVPLDPSDQMALTPLPQEITLLRAVPKLAFVSQRVQAFGAYEYGLLVRWGPTSSGKKSTPTPNGLYFMNWKSKQSVSTDDSTWVLPWLVNFESNRGLSFHQFDLPGYPASHACVRLLEEDARWLYGWAEQWKVSPDGRQIAQYGAPVVIAGEYDFGARPPWKRLLDDPGAAEMPQAEVDSIIAQYLPTILERRVVSDSAPVGERIVGGP